MATLKDAKYGLIRRLRETGVDFYSVKVGPRSTFRVNVPDVDTARKKVPTEWEGHAVAVVVELPRVLEEKEGKVPRLGTSPAFPDKVHVVRKAAMKGGGVVAQWRCERGRGEVYGAVLLTEPPPGSKMCAECFM